MNRRTHRRQPIKSRVFRDSEQPAYNKIIKHKTGLLNLAEELGNVSKAEVVAGIRTSC